MISKILEEVKSPFTDELIKGLIEKYIACGCDDKLFYSEINKLGNAEKTIGPYTKALTDQIYSKINLSISCNNDNAQLVYESSDSWMFINSEKDPMKERQKTPNNRNPLVYRIYLNIKDKQKTDFIQDYIKRFQESKIPFGLKFSQDDERLDQIIILSRSENLKENILAVEELTQNFELGELPLLIGEYKNGIGIAEEYYNKLASPTSVKLTLVKSTIKKYLCDHIDEFENQLSDEEKKKINAFIDRFNKVYEFWKKRSERGHLRKEYYQEKNPMDCAKEHIEVDDEAIINFCGPDLLELSNAIKNIYSNNPEQFISENVQNYRMIGTQVWGFAQDFVFSNETERTFLKSKENEMVLSSEQIGSGLETISRNGLTDEVQGDLISMVEKTDKTNEENRLE